ncbi:hypothetical protein GJ633_08985 [Halorubrum sp. CBA1125]|uniref:DUF5822 domain-containing protein n=1 Tax=Halorubrum sp. CBA1125 TaxID=2668072 RepID=UPI00135D4608|nr:DUF5822 domain-containing protein [Halorubrum sp. CBA1125]MUW14784.1 hypothetical protein [Halorubrum sp. CBA1125]
MQPVERAEFEGVDYAWVMQTTFVVTILVGAPVVAVLSAFVTLDSWGDRAAFAVRVGAPIWFVTAVAVAAYARRADAGDGGVAGADGDEASAPSDVDIDTDDTEDADDTDDTDADASGGSDRGDDGSGRSDS